MDYSKFVDEISEKYGYDEQLKTAIRMAIPLMVEDYGNEQDVLNVFSNVRIFAESDMSRPNRDRIQNEMLGNVTSYVKIDDFDPYNESANPGSYYSYEAIYDENLNVAGEVRWIVVEDLAGTNKAEDYKNTFGTTVNLPYLLHEAGHAYSMQYPVYSRDGDNIYVKHGMWEETKTIVKKDDEYIVQTLEDKGIIAEEADNEFHVQRQLMKFFGVDDYSLVSEKLRSIGHGGSNYNAILIGLAESMEGKIDVSAFRKDNNFDVIKEFNEKALKGDVAQKYLPDVLPYDYLQSNMYAIYETKRDCYKMSHEEYARKMSEFMVEANMPLCSYAGMELNKFESIREATLTSPSNKTV